MTFHIGQKIVCVNDRRCVTVVYGRRWFQWRDRSFKLDHNLNRGTIYRVTDRQALETDDGKSIEIVWVDGAQHFEEPGIGFPSFQFKPLIERKTETDISVFKKMLPPTVPRKLETIG